MTHSAPHSTSLMWKIIHFPITRIIIAVAFVVIPQVIVQAILRPLRTALGLSDSLLLDGLTYGIYVLVAFFAYRLYVQFIEKRPATEVSLEGAGRELGVGALLGTGLFTATIGILWLLGAYRVIGFHDWPAMIPALGLAISSGFTEELLFRGIVFRIAEEGLGTWIALVISAGLFGLLHLANPNASLASGIAVALEAGLLLAAAFVVTRRLWLATGLHVAWNFTQGGIFGVAVSGNQTQSLIQANLDGPAWLSGGNFGAEASVVAVLVCLVAFVVLTSVARNKGRFLKPGWAREPHDIEPAVS